MAFHRRGLLPFVPLKARVNGGSIGETSNTTLAHSPSVERSALRILCRVACLCEIRLFASEDAGSRPLVKHQITFLSRPVCPLSLSLTLRIIALLTAVGYITTSRCTSIYPYAQPRHQWLVRMMHYQHKRNASWFLQV